MDDIILTCGYWVAAVERAEELVKGDSVLDLVFLSGVGLGSLLTGSSTE